MSTKPVVSWMDDPEVFQAEREFLLDTFGWSDPRIAAYWGVRWDTYTNYIRRHPQLPAIVDPEGDAERRHYALVGSIALGRKKSEAR